MNEASSTPRGDPPSRGRHLATITHDGRFWDAYVELEEEASHPGVHRGRVAFAPVDAGEGEESLRTADVIIEPSREDALWSAKRLDTHHLVALLRSLLPESERGAP